MFGYSLNYLIDTDSAVIVDVEATPTRITMEVDATETMIDRTEEHFDLKPARIAGDVAYGTGEMLGWLRRRGLRGWIAKRFATRLFATMRRDWRGFTTVQRATRRGG